MNRRRFIMKGVTAASVAGVAGVAGTQSASADWFKDAVKLARAGTAMEIKPVMARVEPLKNNVVIDSVAGKVEFTKAEPVEVKPAPNTTECVIVQAGKASGGSEFRDPFGITPEIKGTGNSPDVGLSLQLEGFHLSQQIKVSENSRATMRLTTSNTTSLTASGEVLFWAITTGIDLYKQSKKHISDKTKAVDNLSGALSNRPIEMKDGLGSFQIQIIKHKEAPWWRKLFSFLASDDANVITESFGYPAITKAALRYLDSIVEKLSDLKAEPLIQSNFVPYALSERGRAKYETGINVIGRLNSGSWVLVKPKDFPLLVAKKPYFYGTAGRLIPAGKTPLEFMREIEDNPKKDPFYEVTYAVFSSTLKERNFSA